MAKKSYAPLTIQWTHVSDETPAADQMWPRVLLVIDRGIIRAATFSGGRFEDLAGRTIKPTHWSIIEYEVPEAQASTDRTAVLEAALAPFARFYDALRRMGGTSPKSGEWYSLEPSGYPRTLTVEDFAAANKLLPEPE